MVSIKRQVVLEKVVESAGSCLIVRDKQGRGLEFGFEPIDPHEPGLGQAGVVGVIRVRSIYPDDGEDTGAKILAHISTWPMEARGQDFRRTGVASVDHLGVWGHASEALSGPQSPSLLNWPVVVGVTLLVPDMPTATWRWGTGTGVVLRNGGLYNQYQRRRVTANGDEEFGQLLIDGAVLGKLVVLSDAILRTSQLLKRANGVQKSGLRLRLSQLMRSFNLYKGPAFFFVRDMLQIAGRMQNRASIGTNNVDTLTGLFLRGVYQIVGHRFQ